MTTAIISVTNNNNLEELKETLYSIGGSLINIVVIASGKIANELNSDIIKSLCPILKNVSYLNNGSFEDFHMNNFYDAIHAAGGQANGNEIITFLKCGDRIVGPHIFIEVEKEFSRDEHLLTIHAKNVTDKGLNIYNLDYVNLQGWFYKRSFLDYYTFLKTFKNDIEFTLHLSYITNLQPQFHLEINDNFIYINSLISNIGEACQHYFNIVLPEQTFFDVELGLKYLYELICECYITYIQVINAQLPDERFVQIAEDLKSFYNYFRLLELDNLEDLLKVYNNKMKQMYNKDRDLFLEKIPDLTFTEFLENFEKKVKKEEE